MVHAACAIRASIATRASPTVLQHAASRSHDVPFPRRIENNLKATISIPHPRTPVLVAAIPAASLLAVLPASAAAALAEEAASTDRVKSAVESLVSAAGDLERAAESAAGADRARSAVGSLVSAAEDLRRAAVSAYLDLADRAAPALAPEGDKAQFGSAVGDVVSATGDLERAAADIFGRAVSVEESVSEQVGKLLGSGTEATQKFLESGTEALQVDTAGVARMVGDAAGAGMEAIGRVLGEGAPAFDGITDGIRSLSLPTNGAIFNTVSSASSFVTAPLSTAWDAVQLTATSSALQTVAFYASLSVLLLALANQPRE
ncbi:hypothetical protein CLOM_g14999 [Closterium sp. NIES-68]|nr:hypothetical protein CLOM_g14999 [Closterium sp. NIES-68]